MNYFKARYFGAKYNTPFTLPPNEVVDVFTPAFSGDISESELTRRRKEDLRIQDQNNLIIAIAKAYIECQN